MRIVIIIIMLIIGYYLERSIVMSWIDEWHEKHGEIKIWINQGHGEYKEVEDENTGGNQKES